MYSIAVSPKFGDVDGLGHVNNTVMPGWFEQGRKPIYQLFNPDFDFKNWNLIIAHYEIDFVSQLYFQNDVEIRTWISRVGRSSFEVYQEAWQDGNLGARGKTVLVHYDYENRCSKAISDEFREELENHIQEKSIF